ncbi:hypothetical protein M422DRAFT_67075 [Sphaerobolus stellatus SS14]|uniref:Co-chaperone HscB C-terminal oligomerisation domain-containing protein n=1 Tax=Sphaerobolus stellatus (strain SS14) TaxID=990650 RepID=A0A0C9URW2_SPHS4|nr:hypothetical protein M422DRAFT_67075 [Sphaerobolus stellatus SS14]
MSFFQYFDFPDADNAYAIDTRDLHRRFLQTQRVCHPDTWAQEGDREGALAAAQSSQLNKAYQTLLSPLSRAQYILAQHGLEQSETETLENPEFIMEIMDARQEVEDADNMQQLNQLRAVNQERIDETIYEISVLLTDRNWEEARTATIRLKYWLGIHKAAEQRIHDLHD